MSKPKIDKEVQRGYEFFRRAGSPAHVAILLARAELVAESLGWLFDWEDDPEGWDVLGDIDPQTGADPAHPDFVEWQRNGDRQLELLGCAELSRPKLDVDSGGRLRCEPC